MTLHDPQIRFQEYEENHGCFFLGGLLLGGGIAAGGLFGFLGSTQAASEQAAAEQAALAFEQSVYQGQENKLRPYYQGGTEAWRQLLNAMGTPAHPGILTESPSMFGGLPSAPPAYNYQAPTLSTFQASPGYQWQLKQGVQAIQDAAGGRTGTLGGNTLQALQTYGTGLANQDWYNFLNNYQNQYNTAYQANTQNYWNRYNAAANTQQNLWNRLAGTAQVGQQAATLTGPQASLVGAIGNQYNQIGASQAAGTLGQYNALGSSIGGLANYGYLQNLLGGGGASTAGYTPYINSLLATPYSQGAGTAYSTGQTPF